jgi:hypothetical protein
MAHGLKKAQIVYTTRVDGVERFKDTLPTVQQLAQYFNDHKRKGEAVGYVLVKNRTPGFNDQVLTGKLTVEWWDANGYGSKDFENVNAMVDFFHEHPTVGMAVGYRRKLKHR